MAKNDNAIYRVIRIADGNVLACCETEAEVKKIIDTYSKQFLVGVEGFEPVYVVDPDWGKMLKLFHLSYKPFQA